MADGWRFRLRPLCRSGEPVALAVPFPQPADQRTLALQRAIALFLAWLVCSCLTGCLVSSSPPTPANNPASTGAPATTSSTSTSPSPATTDSTGTPATTVEIAQFWEDYPDVPKVPLLTEINGIPIPRQKSAAQQLQLAGALPVDVNNPRASGAAATTPTPGDILRVRVESEPKVMNPITETSAVQTYIAQNVGEALLRQNPETFAWEAGVAHTWITEDAVRLSADYPGHERRIALSNQTPATYVEFSYTVPAPPADGGTPTEPPVVTLLTTAQGAAAGRTWVGLIHESGPAIVHHFWSDEQGVLNVSGLPRSGKYRAIVGDEVEGRTELSAEGSLLVTPLSPDNPLAATLKAAGQTQLTLKPTDYQDVQKETVFTFLLRPEVKWGDGEPLTARDLQFAYAVINNPSVDGDSIRVYYADVISLDAKGPHSIRLKYRQQYFKAIEFAAGIGAYTPPFHFFEAAIRNSADAELKGRQLTLERLSVTQEDDQQKISAHGSRFARFFNNDPGYNRAPLGTGPYRIAQWDRGERITLERNPHYWNKDKPGYVDKILFQFIVDNVTAFQALKAGTIDFCPRLSAEQYHKDVLAEPSDWYTNSYVRASWFTPMFNYIGYNMLKPKFQDPRVRMALSMLFDKETFLKEKLYGEGVVVSGTQYYFGPGYDHAVDPVAYSPETARELLSDAGWADTDNDGVIDKNGERFEIQIYIVPGNKVAQERIELYQKTLKTVGITLDVRTLEWAAFIDRLKSRDFDICTLSWAIPSESDPFQTWHGSEAGQQKRGSNHVSFANPLADQLIDQLRVTLDEKKRQRIHQSFHRLLDQEQPYMFLYCVKDFAVYHQRFRGVKWYRIRPGYDLSEWYVPKEEQLFPAGG